MNIANNAPRFNANMLIIGRDCRNATNKTIAEAIGAPMRSVCQWSAGKSEPSKEQLQALADYLDFPAAFFFREGVAYRQVGPVKWVPILTAIPRQRVTAAQMLANVPDDELPTLLAFLSEIVNYPDNVTRLNP